MEAITSFYIQLADGRGVDEGIRRVVHSKSRLPVMLYVLCGRGGRGGRGIKLVFSAFKRAVRGVIRSAKGSTIGIWASIASTIDVTLYPVSLLRQIEGRPPSSSRVQPWRVPQFGRKSRPEIAGRPLMARLLKFARTFAGYAMGYVAGSLRVPTLNRRSNDEEYVPYALAGPDGDRESLFPPDPSPTKKRTRGGHPPHLESTPPATPFPGPDSVTDFDAGERVRQRETRATPESLPASPSEGVIESEVTETENETSGTGATHRV